MTTEIQGVRLDEGERSAPVLPRDISLSQLHHPVYGWDVGPEGSPPGL